jgi:hypothetical protein
MKQVAISDFLTDAEIEKAIKLKSQKAVREQIIEPNIERINQTLGQENDPAYLAYAVEYVLRRAGYWKD